MDDLELARLREEVALLRERKRLRDAEASGGSSAGASVPSPVGTTPGASAGTLDPWTRREGEPEEEHAIRVAVLSAVGREQFRPSLSAWERALRDHERRQRETKETFAEWANRRQLPFPLGRFAPPDFLIEALLRCGRL